jgi:hypothetical protein
MAIGPEEEIPAMAPGRAVTWAARLSRRAAPAGGDGDPTTASGPGAVTAWAELDEAADLLALAAVDVVGYASTSSAYAIGFEAEVAVVSRLSRRVGVPAAATCAGCVQALRVLGIERVALVRRACRRLRVDGTARRRRCGGVVHRRQRVPGGRGDSGSSPNADDDARSARRLREAMQVVLILLPAEIVVWLVSIA